VGALSRSAGLAGPGRTGYPPQPYRVRRACGHWETVRLHAPPTAFLRACARTVACAACGRWEAQDPALAEPAGRRREAPPRRKE
jgi:hypothetical protein